MLVDLVHGHDEGHLRRFRVVNRLDGLRHDAVVRGNHQHDDIGHLRAPRTHRGERLVARRIEERDDAARRLHVVGADVLGDAAGLAGRDLGAADVVEQRGLAMVDVPHDGDHRGSRGPFDLDDFLAFDEVGLRIVELGGLRLVAHFLDDDHRGLLVEHLVDRRHGARLHERLDDLGRLHRHAVRQLAHRNRLGHRDLADQGLRRRSKGGRLVGRLAAMAPAARVPAAYPAACIAAGLDLAPAHRVVAQDGGGLRLLRLLVDLAVARRLRRVQRRGRRGAARRLGRLLLGLLALAVLPFLHLGGLQVGELLLAPLLLLSQLALLCVDACRRGGRRRDDRGRRGRRLLGSHGGRGDLVGVALHEDALLAHLHLHRAVLAGRVRFLDLARLLAGERDLVLRFGRAVRLAQVFEEARLVLLAERVGRHFLLHAGGAELLEQDRRGNLQLARKLGYAGLRHVMRTPCCWPASPRHPVRTSAHAPP
jgi:hypothetical protein